VVPAPPDFRTISPLFETWHRGAQMVRVFNPRFLPNEFNPGRGAAIAKGRFHFFADTRGGVVPVLYAASMDDAAMSETIFHDVPVQGATRSLDESRLKQASIVTLRPERDLNLVQLHGFGLRRLQLQPGDLTSTEASEYPQTVRWAHTLHRSFPQADGLVWMSRQFNSAKALILFGDRVQSAELSVADTPVPLYAGPGRTLVEEAANRAGIIITT
jgi:hypothetical protein